MDYLKTRAPFWKKEITRDGSAHWVEAKASDEGAAARWEI
jgi:molybdopterin synthase catalytic subunit